MCLEKATHIFYILQSVGLRMLPRGPNQNLFLISTLAKNHFQIFKNIIYTLL